MTIDEAIEALERRRKYLQLPTSGVIHDAIELGIEALKALKILRSPASVNYPHILPGETKD